MADGHEKRIEQGLLHRVIELALQREHEQRDTEPGQCKADEDRQHDGPHRRRHRLHPQEEIQVEPDDRAYGQQDQPDGRRLLEILLKGLEKAADRGAVLIPHQLQGHIVDRRGGRSYGENGDAADDPQQVQHHDIEKFADKAPYRIVVIKERCKHRGSSIPSPARPELFILLPIIAKNSINCKPLSRISADFRKFLYNPAPGCAIMGKVTWKWNNHEIKDNQL